MKSMEEQKQSMEEQKQSVEEQKQSVEEQKRCRLKLWSYAKARWDQSILR